MIIGIGTDILDTMRLREARHFSRCAEYILTGSEITEMHDSSDALQFLASRLAAKEAVIKASGAKIGYHDVVISKRGDVPHAEVSTLSDVQFLVSISHVTEYVTATAIATTI